MGVSGENNLFLQFSINSYSEILVVPGEQGGGGLQGREHLRIQVQLTYTPTSDSFVLGGRVLKLEDRSELFGRAVTVADGSIVLFFEDIVQLPYPFDMTTAANVTTSAGSKLVKNTTCNDINIIGIWTTSNVGSTYQSGWLIVHTIDDTGETGGTSIGVLHTEGSGNAFTEPAIQCAPTGTTISAQGSTDNTVSATMNSTGRLFFDSSDAAIYFGSSQDLRIIFSDPIFSIQSYESGAGEAVRGVFGTKGNHHDMIVKSLEKGGSQSEHVSMLDQKRRNVIQAAEDVERKLGIVVDKSDPTEPGLVVVLET
eukprot:jgi/Undpi1/224/HiC_scaffold_1.g00221.m1